MPSLPPTRSLDSPPDADTEIFASAPEPGPRIEAGRHVGRYLILHELGRGGMGVVYKAYDPELDRQVALKFLAVSSEEPARRDALRTRLVREAQALAQLSHPNVVGVYDVGTEGEDVFVSMELIDGAPLRSWLKEEQRSVEEIVEAFVAAGEGLSAAHRAGLVHRDFKPANVMVGRDGRVRVLDFGLARAIDEDETTPGSTCSEDGTSGVHRRSASRLLSGRLTDGDVAMGTPVYMSPEQHQGGSASPASDQFSFCVSLHEALFGFRPFTGRTRRELRRNVLTGERRLPEAGHGVASHIERAIVRGVSVAPARRFPTMDELLAELRRDPHARLKRASWFAMATALTGVAFVGWTRDTHSSSSVCQSAAEAMARVWNGERRRSLVNAFEGLEQRFASDSAQRVASVLDDYAGRWIDVHTEACRATHVHGVASENLLDRKMLCLDRKNQQVVDLLTLLTDAPSDGLVENAVSTTMEVARLTDCTDDDALLAASPLPEDPQLRARVEELHRKLSKSQILQAGGRFDEAIELAIEVAEAMRTLNYPPLQASATYRVADIRGELGQYDASLQGYREALVKASEAGDAHLVAEIWSDYLWTWGYLAGQAKDALAHEISATVALELAGDPPDIRVDVERSLGVLESTQGNHERALGHFERAVALYEETGNDVFLASGLNDLGIAHKRMGHFAQARAHYQRAYELWKKHLGEEHPQISRAHTNLCTLETARRNLAEAEPHCLRAMSLDRLIFGEDHPDTARSRVNLAQLRWARGEYKTAETLARSALTVFEDKLPSNHPYQAATQMRLAAILRDLGRADESREVMSEALERMRESLGAEHEWVAMASGYLASIECALGQTKEARARFEEAIAVQVEAKAPLPDRVEIASLAAQCDLEAGEHLSAITRTATIIELLGADESGLSKTLSAEPRFLAAKARWNAPETRAEALELAQAAVDDLTDDSSPRGRALREEILGWLGERTD